MHVDKNYFWGHIFLNIHIISKPLDLGQMRMGQIKNNSVGIKNSNRGNIQQAIKNFLQHLFIRLFIRFIYYHYLENTKQLKNEMKQQKKKKEIKICHVNAGITAYLISYLAFCFGRLKPVQNVSLKHSRTSRSQLYLKLINDRLDVAR